MFGLWRVAAAAAFVVIAQRPDLVKSDGAGGRIILTHFLRQQLTFTIFAILGVKRWNGEVKNIDVTLFFAFIHLSICSNNMERNAIFK